MFLVVLRPVAYPSRSRTNVFNILIMIISSLYRVRCAIAGKKPIALLAVQTFAAF